MCIHSVARPISPHVQLITMYTKTRSICTRLHRLSSAGEASVWPTCSPRPPPSSPPHIPLHPVHTSSEKCRRRSAEDSNEYATLRRSVFPHAELPMHCSHSPPVPPVPPVPPNNPHTDLTCSPYSAVPTSLQPYDIRGRLWLHVAEIAEIARVAHVLFRLVALVRRR